MLCYASCLKPPTVAAHRSRGKVYGAIEETMHGTLLLFSALWLPGSCEVCEVERLLLQITYSICSYGRRPTLNIEQPVFYTNMS